MATLKINGKEITVEDNTLILDAAKEAGYDIPTFCYQADLSRLGSCRMCLVEIGGQRKLQPSCVTPVMPDMEVTTESQTILDARAGVLEFFLSNHGLDCPVCDKGGECELQNMVYKHGPHLGAHAEKKVRFHEQDYTLSPVIVKNSNRCVQCQRCVRVCAEAVGVGVLGAQGRGAHQEETSFLRTELECDHCGNCIEVCPVGSFMRRPYRYQSRPWDLKSATSICPYCATGCRITIQERDGVVVRSLSKEGTGVNNELLCARGRFGFDFVNSSERLTRPMRKCEDGTFTEISWPEAIKILEGRLHHRNPQRIGALASARLTNEELYLLQKMMRGLFRTDNIDSSLRFDADGVKAFIKAMGINKGASSLREALKAEMLLIIGSQVSDENPITDYLLRLTIDVSRKAVVIVSPRAMKLDRSATRSLRSTPGSEGKFMSAVAARLFEDNRDRFSTLECAGTLASASASSFAVAAGVAQEEIDKVVADIVNAKNISLFIGTEFLRSPASTPGLVMLTDVLRALGKKLTLVPLLDRNNQRGAWDMGMLPGLNPGYASSGQSGLKCDGMLSAAIDGEMETLYVVGEDVINMYPDERFARKALEAVEFLIVQDSFMTDTAHMADLVLPSASFAEKRGTYTNQEGRVQLIEPLVTPPGEAKTDSQIFGALTDLIDDSFAPLSAKAAFDEIRGSNAMYKDIEFSPGKLDASLVKSSAGSDALDDGSLCDSGDVEIKTPGPGRFNLVTGNHLYFSGMLSSRSEVLGSLQTDPVVEISEADAVELGIKSGEKVVVKGEHVSFLFILRTRKGTRRGVAFIAENYADTPVNRYFRRGEGPPLVTIKRAGK